MGALSAPGPNGFSGHFFQHCWEIVGTDVILTVQDFFHSGVVTPGLNSNFIVLLPKMRDSIIIDQFRPIMLGSFLFKVLPKSWLAAGYFGWSRGVRQGDPFCPLLFGIAEDFLSWSLSRMVALDQLLPIPSPRDFSAPTYLLYADDVLIFCRGTVRNLRRVVHAFRVYGSISNLLVNWSKSFIFFGSSVSPARISSLQSLVGMQIGRLPFSYLEVPFFRGKPRKSVLMPIADKILSKFAKWKDLALLNDSLLRKLTWKFITSNNFAFTFLRERCIRQLQKPHGGYITSSIWNSFRTNYVEHIKYGIWLIGENTQRDFWPDNWLGVLILDLLGIPDFLGTHLHARISDFIRDGRWILDDRFRARFPDLCFRIGRIAISPVTYYLVWPHSREGSVSCKAAYSRMFHDIPQVPWWRDVWSRYIPPSHSVLSWRFLLDWLPTEDRLCRFGFQLASRCSVCGASLESVDHLFLKCPLATALWEAVFSAFQRRVSAYTWGSFFRQVMSVSFSDQIRVLWRAVIHAVVWNVWYSRNQWIFEGKSVDFRALLSLVWSFVYDSNCLGISCMRNNVDDLLILHRFGLSDQPGKASVIRSVVWSSPAPEWIKVFAFEAKLLEASLAINYAWNLGWHRIWLESDSSYVVQLLSIRSNQVTWRVRQAWQRCIHQILHMEFQVSHIFREGNQVANALSKHALGLSSDSWLSSTPSFCSSLVGNDCLGRESFRIS
ncbi:hypothetical protein Dsin_001243 [Dipteronia sinensis]|uniref:Reverse transcriptase domain-containing protein n=1 Tax=Dipteronia sinensis TaxID=43782 RepID=A0AAE0B4S1_9ROSI|nr:hypothetical protein Dsin_001243 [Dipteronia sinensis]